MTAYHRSPETKARMSIAVASWWRTRHEAEDHLEDPLDIPIEVDDAVRQTGLRGRGRRMRVTAIKGSSARCEWTHDGQQHADWFCVSGLRRST